MPTFNNFTIYNRLILKISKYISIKINAKYRNETLSWIGTICVEEKKWTLRVALFSPVAEGVALGSCVIVPATGDAWLAGTLRHHLTSLLGDGILPRYWVVRYYTGSINWCYLTVRLWGALSYEQNLLRLFNRAIERCVIIRTELTKVI